MIQICHIVHASKAAEPRPTKFTNMLISMVKLHQRHKDFVRLIPFYSWNIFCLVVLNWQFVERSCNQILFSISASRVWARYHADGGIKFLTFLTLLTQPHCFSLCNMNSISWVRVYSQAYNNCRIRVMSSEQSLLSRIFLNFEFLCQLDAWRMSIVHLRLNLFFHAVG